ncbi:MAG: hypothetical protein HYS08_06560 [Chlamydiae bacterium]|nr:hypothetical protein [Chlamydiota bacterium]MBI3265576.1 hypothetical protein [Chlamydiota bacterium]
MEIPEFSLASFLPESADAEIFCGKVPDLKPHSKQLVLDIKEVARFLITEGRKIIYEPCRNSDQDTLRLFLLGSCMGALMQQRGHVVLHGNAISRDGKTCQVFVGDRGAGKSTLAAWYYQQGAYVLADDVCAIGFDRNGKPYVIPSFPQIKLWQKGAELLEINTSYLRRVRPGDDKFGLPIHSQYCDHPLPLTEVIEIKSRSFTRIPLTGTEKIKILIQHSYRYHFLRAMVLEYTYSRSLARLAQQVDFAKMGRVNLDFLSIPAKRPYDAKS